MSTRPDSVEGEILDRILEIQRRMHAHFEATAESFGLTPAQAHALHFFQRPRPMRAAADHMRCDASYITHLTDDLEELGLARRRPDPDDRRVKQVVLTEHGLDQHRRLREALHESSPAFAALDGDERRRLLELLRALTPDLEWAVPA